MSVSGFVVRRSEGLKTPQILVVMVNLSEGCFFIYGSWMRYVTGFCRNENLMEKYLRNMVMQGVRIG